MYNKAEEQTELVTELLTDKTELINDSIKSDELNQDYAGKLLSGIYQVREVIG